MLPLPFPNRESGAVAPGSQLVAGLGYSDRPQVQTGVDAPESCPMTMG